MIGGIKKVHFHMPKRRGVSEPLVILAETALPRMLRDDGTLATDKFVRKKTEKAASSRRPYEMAPKGLEENKSAKIYQRRGGTKSLLIRACSTRALVKGSISILCVSGYWECIYNQ